MKMYAPKQSQDDFGKDSIIFFFKWSFSFILSTISEQSFAWGKKAEEWFFLINAVEFQEPYFPQVFLRVEKNAQNLPFRASLILKLTSVIFSKLTA